MTSETHLSWHRWLLVKSYASIGQTDIPDFDRVGYAGAVLTSLVFLAFAAVICVVLNAGTLLFGIAVEPIWTGRDKMRLLTLPGNIPLVLITMPVLVVYGLWRTAVSYGVAVTLAPFIVTGLLGFGLLGCILLFNNLRCRV